MIDAQEDDRLHRSVADKKSDGRHRFCRRSRPGLAPAATKQMTAVIFFVAAQRTAKRGATNETTAVTFFVAGYGGRVA